MKNSILKRSIIVISILLLIICAFSCVYAADENPSEVTMETLSKNIFLPSHRHQTRGQGV